MITSSNLLSRGAGAPHAALAYGCLSHLEVNVYPLHTSSLPTPVQHHFRAQKSRPSPFSSLTYVPGTRDRMSTEQQIIEVIPNCGNIHCVGPPCLFIPASSARGPARCHLALLRPGRFYGNSRSEVATFSIFVAAQRPASAPTRLSVNFHSHPRAGSSAYSPSASRDSPFTSPLSQLSATCTISISFRINTYRMAHKC